MYEAPAIPAARRVLARSRDNGEGCLVYDGAVSTTGYGQVRVVKPDVPTTDRVKRYRTVEAHRVVWESHRGAIPTNTYVMHTCRNKLCMNTQHMKLYQHK